MRERLEDIAHRAVARIPERSAERTLQDLVERLRGDFPKNEDGRCGRGEARLPSFRGSVRSGRPATSSELSAVARLSSSSRWRGDVGSFVEITSKPSCVSLPYACRPSSSRPSSYRPSSRSFVSSPFEHHLLSYSTIVHIDRILSKKILTKFDEGGSLEVRSEAFDASRWSRERTRHAVARTVSIQFGAPINERVRDGTRWQIASPCSCHNVALIRGFPSFRPAVC